MELQEEFERAKEEEPFRKKFIRMIDLKPYAQYVKSVRYNPVQFYASYAGFEKTPSWMTTTPPRRAFFEIPGGKSKIEIYPKAFSCRKVDDFLSTLIDHEILGHARRYFEGNFLTGKEELYITSQHFDLLQKRKCSVEYIAMAKKNLAILQRCFGKI